MAEQRLQHAEVDATVQKMGGEGVAQHMRGKPAPPVEVRLGAERLQVAREFLPREVARLAQEGKSRCCAAALLLRPLPSESGPGLARLPFRGTMRSRPPLPFTVSISWSP